MGRLRAYYLGFDPMIPRGKPKAATDPIETLTKTVDATSKRSTRAHIITALLSSLGTMVLAGSFVFIETAENEAKLEKMIEDVRSVEQAVADQRVGQERRRLEKVLNGQAKDYVKKLDEIRDRAEEADAQCQSSTKELTSKLEAALNTCWSKNFRR